MFASVTLFCLFVYFIFRCIYFISQKLKHFFLFHFCILNIIFVPCDAIMCNAIALLSSVVVFFLFHLIDYIYMVLTFVISPIKCIKMHIFGFFSRPKIESGWQFNWLHFFAFLLVFFIFVTVVTHFIFFLPNSLVLKAFISELWFMFYVFSLCIRFYYCFSFCIFWNLSMCTQLPHETGCELFEIVIYSEGYNENRFRNDLKLLFTQIGVHNQRTVVLFSMIGDQVSWTECMLVCICFSVCSNNNVSFSHHFCTAISLTVMELWKCIKTIP